MNIFPILIIKLISGGRHIVYAGLQKCSSSYDLIKNKQVTVLLSNQKS
jgi:hypothetical protein